MTTEPDTDWIRRHAHPLRAREFGEALDDLAPLREGARAAVVVGLGAAARDTRELSVTAHRVLRVLVEDLGFRALALEGDDAAGVAVDDYVRTGAGDPRALMAGARSFWRTQELLDVVTYLREYNVRHPGDPVRIVHDTEPARHTPTRPDDLGRIEKLLADNVIRWHERTGDKVVYWGGMAHTVNGKARTVLLADRRVAHRSAGSYFRERFGNGYLSMALMFDHGEGQHSYPAPPPEFVDAALGRTDLDAYLLDLRGAPPSWLDLPAKTRLIGPVYDPADDAAHHLAGGRITEWFDMIVHHRQVRPARLLEPLAGA
ncbi:erythromycin esterase [Nocardia transvalensis]|uniref:Erythromycin esterase n=1 Tax=Nocardia transvalensis TaxID=37333 RepID=A0A7W9P814_9NOCA|nr:erythromycin esterase family protein [Nocardia transvalensis]MBB5911199.1 erythromycin esterase [Nocardia transvalensis]